METVENWVLFVQAFRPIFASTKATSFSIGLSFSRRNCERRGKRFRTHTFVQHMSPFLSFLTGFTVGCAAAISPGPDTLLMVRSVATSGLRGGLACTFGIVSAMIVHSTVTIAFTTYLQKLLPLAIPALQVTGGVYLLFLSYLHLRQPTLSRKINLEGAIDAPQPVGRLYAFGLLTNLLNPKALIFFSAVVTPLMSADGAIWSALSLTGGILFAVAAWFLLLTLLLARFSKALINPMSQRILARVAGILFLLFGLLSFLSLSSKVR